MKRTTINLSDEAFAALEDAASKGDGYGRRFSRSELANRAICDAFLPRPGWFRIPQLYLPDDDGLTAWFNQFSERYQASPERALLMALHVAMFAAGGGKQ